MIIKRMAVWRRYRVFIYPMLLVAVFCSGMSGALPSQAAALANSSNAPAVTAQWGEIPLNEQVRSVLGISTNAVVMGVTLKAVEPDGVIYAPFAVGQSEADIRKVEGVVRPLGLRPSGDFPGRDATLFYYPPGVLKTDPFSGLHLPVYSGETLLLAVFSAEAAGHMARVQLSALVCTSRSCTPFQQIYSFSLPSSPEGETVHGAASVLAARLSADQAKFYRTAPFYPIAGNDGGMSKIAAMNSLVEASDTAAPPEGGDSRFESYMQSVTPSYFQAGLEVFGLWKAVLFGLAAGLILNFMPCVLPVITFKIGTLVGLGGWSALEGDSEAARTKKRQFRTYGLFFSLGIFLWFTLLFVVIGAAGYMWGQFFQNQGVIVALTVILFLLALSLLGLIKIPVLKLKGAKSTVLNPKHASLGAQAFFGGLLATLMATPCSGPLLGGVLGWAISQSVPVLGVTLLSVAVGMASPFLFIAVCPGIARRLPKPGPWTIKLEMIMGFVLLGTVIYFLTLLPSQKLPLMLFCLLLVAFAAWMWKWAPRKQRFGPSRCAAVLALLAAICLPLVTGEEEARWDAFAPGSFAASAGRENLLVDFTADWCINCKVVEAATLTPKRLAAMSKTYALRMVKVDLTHSNPAGEALLQALGSASIPLIAIIPAASPHEPVVLRDIVTPDQLDAALKSVF